MTKIIYKKYPDVSQQDFVRKCKIVGKSCFCALKGKEGRLRKRTWARDICTGGNHLQPDAEGIERQRKRHLLYRRLAAKG